MLLQYCSILIKSIWSVSNGRRFDCNSYLKGFFPGPDFSRGRRETTWPSGGHFLNESFWLWEKEEPQATLKYRPLSRWCPFSAVADSRLTAFFRQEPEGNDINKYDHHHFDEDTLKEVLCSVDLCWKTWLRTWNVGKVALWPSTSLSLLRFFLSIFNELVRWLFPYFFSSSGGSE